VPERRDMAVTICDGVPMVALDVGWMRCKCPAAREFPLMSRITNERRLAYVRARS